MIRICIRAILNCMTHETKRESDASECVPDCLSASPPPLYLHYICLVKVS